MDLGCLDSASRELSPQITQNPEAVLVRPKEILVQKMRTPCSVFGVIFVTIKCVYIADNLASEATDSF